MTSTLLILYLVEKFQTRHYYVVSTLRVYLVASQCMSHHFLRPKNRGKLQYLEVLKIHPLPLKREIAIDMAFNF